MYKIPIGKKNIELPNDGLVFLDVRKEEQESIVESIVRCEETTKEESSAIVSIAHSSQNFYASLSVFENLLLAAGISPSEQEIERGNQILERVGLSNHKDDPTHVLNVDEKRRLLLARAIMSDKPILIVNLPFESKELPSVLPMLREVAKDHLVLFVMEGVESLCESADGFLLVREGKIEKEILPEKDRIEPSKEEKNTSKPSFFSLFRFGFKTLHSKILLCLYLFLLAVMTGAIGGLIHGYNFDKDTALAADILDRGVPPVLQTNDDLDEDQASELQNIVSEGFVPVSYPSVIYNNEEIGKLSRTHNLALYQDSQMARYEILIGRKPESSTDILLPLNLAKKIAEVGYHDPFTFQTTADTVEGLIGQPLFSYDYADRAFSKTLFEPYVICGIVDIQDPTLNRVAYVNKEGLNRSKERPLSLHFTGHVDDKILAEIHRNDRINLNVFEKDNTFSLFFDKNKTQLLKDEVLINLPYVMAVNGKKTIDFSIPAELSATGKEETYRQDFDTFFSQTLYRNAIDFVSEANVDEAFHSEKLPIEKMTEKYYADQNKEVPTTIEREDQVQIVGRALEEALDNFMNWIPYSLDVVQVYQETAKENIDRCLSERTIRIQVEDGSPGKTIEKKIVGCYVDRFWGSTMYNCSFGLSMNEDEILPIKARPKAYTAAFIQTPSDRKTLVTLLKKMQEFGFEFANDEIRDMKIDIHVSKPFYGWWTSYEIMIWVLLSLAFASFVLFSFVLLRKKYQTARYETETLLSLGWSKKEHDIVLFAPFVALLLSFLILSILSVVGGIFIYDAFQPFWVPFTFLTFLLPIAITALLCGIFLKLRKRKKEETLC